MTDDAHILAQPVIFQPEMEHLEVHEEAEENGLEGALKAIRENNYRRFGCARRGLHAKSHGILLGTLSVLKDLPPILAQGLFREDGVYKVIMRFSTLPGMILKDEVSMPRGVALKVQGVRGERLSDSSGDQQDFLMVNSPTFGAPTVKAFHEFIRSVAEIDDRSRGLDVPDSDILGEAFYSQTPFLYGRYVCKFALAPVSDALKRRTNKGLDVSDDPNALRDSVVDFFATQGGEWELKVQLATDRQSMPIEDSTVEWRQDESPYIAVASLSMPAQNAWDPSNVKAVDEAMSFNPWNGLAAHRPLGSINRARKPTYATSVAFRETSSARETL